MFSALKMSMLFIITEKRSMSFSLEKAQAFHSLKKVYQVYLEITNAIEQSVLENRL